jgi:purine-nucleoside phosphorylase
MSSSEQTKLEALTHALSQAWSHRPQAVVTLGSGLGQTLNLLNLSNTLQLPYSSLPHVPQPSVEGHTGSLTLGITPQGLPIAVMQGRFHFYEGHDWPEVVRLLRACHLAGAHTALITNAAGCLHPEWQLGQFMLIRDQLNLTGHHPLRGENLAFLGPRFYDMSQAFCPQLAEAVAYEAQQQGWPLYQGVYAGVMGPSYETPAEIRALATLGADAVGMSTVAEVLAARHMGMGVLGLSCLTNLAAGLAATNLNHAEVTACGANPHTQTQLAAYLNAALATL